MSTSRLLHCCFLLLVCLTSACNPIPDTIKIGVAQPLTGPLAAQGNDLLHGVQMAVNEINAQGLRIKGKAVTLEIVQGDDQSSAEEGKRVAEMLVGSGVVAVVGHLNSGVSIPAAPIYAAKNIPQLAISTKPDYTQLGLPTTFRIVGNDSMQSKALGSYAAQQMDGKVFALGPANTKDARCVVLQKALSKAQNEAGVTPRRGFATLRKAFWGTTLRERGHWSAARRCTSRQGGCLGSAVRLALRSNDHVRTGIFSVSRPL
jgi:branched-chain amino acid transport system substrate-binding protein